LTKHNIFQKASLENLIAVDVSTVKFSTALRSKIN